MKIVVLDGYALNPGDLSWMSCANSATWRFTTARVKKRSSSAAPALRSWYNKVSVSAATIARLPDLRYIGVVATGYNIVDIAAARQAVSWLPTSRRTALHRSRSSRLLFCWSYATTLACIARRSGKGSGPVADWSFWKTPQIELAGKTLGVFGIGRIGSRPLTSPRPWACGSWPTMR